MFDVLCIGETDCDLIFAQLPKIPQPGKEEYCSDFFIKAGGAANTAMGLSKLGCKTLLATEVGTDVLGNIVHDFIRRTGVNMEAVNQCQDVRTSVTAVLTVDGERGFATFNGGGLRNISEEKLEALIINCKHIHTYIGYCRTMPILELAHKHHKTVSLDTSWVENIHLEDISDLVSGCNFFTPNDKEALHLTGTEDVEEALDVLSKLCPMPVITCGKYGSIAKYENRFIRSAPVNAGHVVDTTGAGDLFCAGLVYSFLNQWDPQKMLNFANAAGSLAVTFYGGMDDRFNLENIYKLV